MPVDAVELPEAPGVDEESRVHLAGRYGHAANLVMRLAAADPRLAERISPDLPDIAAEAAFAVDHEQAHTVGDVLLRRTRLGLLDARQLSEDGAGGPATVARAMAGLLDWDDAQMQRELADWAEEARAEGLVPAVGTRPAPAAAAHDGTAPAPDGRPGEPSPAAPGTAPEEAA
jgi:glycerol-3-phosphate dehydrogenase